MLGLRHLFKSRKLWPLCERADGPLALLLTKKRTVTCRQHKANSI